MPKPVFQKDGSLSMIRATVPAYVFGEHYSGLVVSKKQNESDQDPGAELGWAHDEALVTLCRIAVVDQ